MKTRIGRTLFGAGMLLSLSFGATQAVASAESKASGPYCRTAPERTACYLDCQAEGKIGICDTDIGCYCI